MTSSRAALAFGVLTFVSTASGGLLALRRRRDLYLAMAGSAGLLLGAAVLDLAPEAWRLVGAGRASAAMAAGIVAYAALHHFLHRGAAAHGTPGREAVLGHAGALGLTVHSLLDGVAIGTAFGAGSRIGVLVAAAVVAHDFGDGVSTVALVLASRGRKQVTVAWLLANALAPIAGVALAGALLVAATALAYLLAFFAGSFVYLALGHLLPEAKLEGGWGRTLVAFGLGVAVVALVRVAAQ